MGGTQWAVNGCTKLNTMQMAVFPGTRFVYNQEYGLDYSETFRPVIQQETIRLVLSLVVRKNWIINQLDVSNAFLHGMLDETIYMTQPLGYVDPASLNMFANSRSLCMGSIKPPVLGTHV